MVVAQSNSKKKDKWIEENPISWQFTSQTATLATRWRGQNPPANKTANNKFSLFLQLFLRLFYF